MEEAPRPDPDALLRLWRERGDAADLGALFDATAPELFAVALHLCRDPARAEDAVQETYLAALASLDRFDGDRRVVPWLAGILRNKVHEVRRFEGRAPDPRRLTLPMDPEDPQVAAATAEEKDRVHAALDELEEPYREVAILRWRHGLDPAEIAAVKRMAPGTVRSLLHRATESIRRRFTTFPALLLLREGAHPPRGLSRVREEVLRRAPVCVGGGVAGAGFSVLLGGVLVAKKILIGGLLLAAATGAWLLGLPVGEEAPRPAPEGSIPFATASAPPPPSIAPSQEALPAPKGISQSGGTRRATGIVVDREGRPVPGARVTSFPGDLGEAVTSADLARNGNGLLAAVAGADGWFEVELSRLSPRATLLAEAAGFTPGVLAEVIDGEEARLVLDRAAAVVGVVVDGEGSPLEGVRVKVRRLLDSMILDREGFSGADGRFRVGEVPAAVDRSASRSAPDMMVIEASAKGFGPFFSDIIWPVPASLIPGGNWETRIVLVRGWTLRGRAVEAGNGVPVDGARVVAWDDSGAMGMGRQNGSLLAPPFTPRLLGEAVTGPDGVFQFEDLPASGAVMEAKDLPFPTVHRFRAGVAAGKMGWAWVSERLEEMSPGGRREVILALETTGEVEGRVVDERGLGLPGVSVFVNAEGLPLGGGLPRMVAADAGTKAVTGVDGRYRIPSAPGEKGGPRGVILQAASKDVRYRSLRPEEGVSVEVVPGHTAVAPDIRLEDVLIPFADILVTDEAGRPVWGAQAKGTGRMQPPVSDGEGRMRVFGTVERGNPRKVRPLRVYLQARGHGSAFVDLRPAFEEGPAAQVVLGSPHFLTGLVLEADGRPAKAAVNVRSMVDGPQDDSLDDGTFGGVVVAEDGTFRVEDLPEGPYRVFVRGVSLFKGGSVPEERREVVLDDVPTDARDLEVRFPAPTAVPAGTVEGVVTDAVTGRPLLRCDAELRGPRGFFMARRGVDNPGGRFRIEGVPEGTWTLRVFVEGYAPFERDGVEVAEGKAPPAVVVVLSKGAGISGILQMPAGISPGESTIYFESAAPGNSGSRDGARATVVSDGTYRVQGLAPGAYRATVLRRYTGGDPVYPLVPADGGTVQVSEGSGETTYDPVLVVSGLLTVALRDPRFPLPVEGRSRTTEEQDSHGRASRLLLLDAGGRVIKEASPLRQGSLGLDHMALLPGDYVLRLETPGEVREERVVVQAGKEASVVFKEEQGDDSITK